MMYKSHKGEVEIATMPLRYASNALAKLQREEPGRVAEIEALEAHVASLDQDGEPANPRAVIGDNNPPEEPKPVVTGRTAIDVHVADLLTEVQGCCLVIENEEQAGAVGRLHRKVQEAIALVDGSAATEKKPHNDALNEIGVWQNGYTAAKLKKTPDGSLTKALLATSNLSTAWLTKLDDDRRKREAETAKAAQEAAVEAIALRQEAKQSTDTEVMDRADDALAQAQALIQQAVGVSKEKVQAGGGEGYRALGLRSTYTAVVCEEPGSWGLAYGHYKQNPEFMAEFHALLQRWADRDARTEATRVRGVPGFKFIEDRKAA